MIFPSFTCSSNAEIAMIWIALCQLDAGSFRMSKTGSILSFKLAILAACPPACRLITSAWAGKATTCNKHSGQLSQLWMQSPRQISRLLTHPFLSVNLCSQHTAWMGTAKYRTVGILFSSLRLTSTEALYGYAGMTWQPSCGFLRRALRGNDLEAEKQLLHVPAGSSWALWVWSHAL